MSFSSEIKMFICKSIIISNPWNPFKTGILVVNKLNSVSVHLFLYLNKVTDLNFCVISYKHLSPHFTVIR